MRTDTKLIKSLVYQTKDIITNRALANSDILASNGFVHRELTRFWE